MNRDLMRIKQKGLMTLWQLRANKNNVPCGKSFDELMKGLRGLKS